MRERLLADILSGRWRPGDRLPTEPELTALFGVSRTPIREAMQSLSLLGVVDIAPRRGAIVKALPLESVVDMAILSGAMAPERSVGDFFDFRFETESATARLAAINATPEQVAAIRVVLRENEAAVRGGDRELARSVDVRFHAAIAEASGNVVFEALAHALNGLLVDLRRVTGGIPGASEASYAEHVEILAAITAQDGTAAQRASEAHIRKTRARFEAARPSGRLSSR
ncbi:MAG: FadR family transcriptional regulator [Chloroflexi bacterium]|nr:FadR family transcriptional regulator [Chloroflexota bacterium]